jgi:hypothetical protein
VNLLNVARSSLTVLVVACIVVSYLESFSLLHFQTVSGAITKTSTTTTTIETPWCVTSYFLTSLTFMTEKTETGMQEGLGGPYIKLFDGNVGLLYGQPRLILRGQVTIQNIWKSDIERGWLKFTIFDVINQDTWEELIPFSEIGHWGIQKVDVYIILPERLNRSLSLDPSSLSSIRIGVIVILGRATVTATTPRTYSGLVSGTSTITAINIIEYTVSEFAPGEWGSVLILAVVGCGVVLALCLLRRTRQTRRGERTLAKPAAISSASRTNTTPPPTFHSHITLTTLHHPPENFSLGFGEYGSRR